MNSNIPEKSFYVRTDKESPWYNKSIINLRKERRRKERKYKNNKNSENKKDLNDARNKLVSAIKKAKSNYLIGHIDNSKHNTKHLFKIINP